MCREPIELVCQARYIGEVRHRDARSPEAVLRSRSDRTVTTVLTIQPKDKDGNQRWELADGATLYDVTQKAGPNPIARRHAASCPR